MVSSLSSSRFVHLTLLLQNLYSPSQEETTGFLLTSVTIMPILSNLLEHQLLLVIPLTVTLFIRSFLFSPLTISLKNLQTLALVIQTLLLLSCIISLIIYQLHWALTFHFFTRSKSSLKAQGKIIHCFFSIVKIVEIFVQKKINRVGSNYASFHYVYWQLVICSSDLLMAHSNLFTVHWKAVTHFCLQPSHWILHLSQFLKYLFSTSEANKFLKKAIVLTKW